MKNKCCKDHDDELIIKNKHIFDCIHKKKSVSLIDYNINPNENIYVPVTINICLTQSKYNIDFIKYCYYIINILNDGFSGNIKTKYKNTSNSENFIYNLEYFKNIFKDKLNPDKYANEVYNYINTNTDTKIRFYLKSIEYFNKNFEIEFINNDTELLINSFFNSGFSIREENKLNLNINIMHFTCSTLGVATFPWMKYLLKVPRIMMIFIDYNTIHSDIVDNKCNQYNQCRTVIHEAGHIFGLRHTFNNNKECLNVYKILLGKIIFEKEFREDINKQNSIDNLTYNKKKKNKNDVSINSDEVTYVLNKINKTKQKTQLYIDIPCQENPTIFNPIETNDFQINNYDQIVDFACFMDYSPDEVLTHFSLSQKKIMLYFIKIFMPYLLKKKNNSSNIFTINLYNNLYFDYNTSRILEKSNNLTSHFYNYQIKFNDEFNYEFIFTEKPLINIIGNKESDNTLIINTLKELLKKI